MSYATAEKVSAVAAADLIISTTRDLADARTLPAITETVRHAARRVVGADGATFVLREDAQCYYVDEDAIAPLWKGKRFPLASCISGWAMVYRQQAIIPDIYKDQRIPHDAYRATFVKSLVMTPVRTLLPWAAIGVYWAKEYTPAAEEAGWLQALADSTAVAMENVRVMMELKGGGAIGLADMGEVVKMCAWTKRFLMDGQWVSVEEYLQRRFGLNVTHGISEEALASLDVTLKPVIQQN